jgi:hypothetical protein
MTALEPVTLNTSQVTPPRHAGEVKKSVLVFDDFDRLLDLLREFPCICVAHGG